MINPIRKMFKTGTRSAAGPGVDGANWESQSRKKREELREGKEKESDEDC